VTAPTQGLVLLLLALIVLGFGGFFWRALVLYRLLRLGRNEDRTDSPARRLRDEIVIYLGQRKLLKRPYYVRGLGHALIFWGFLVITYGSADLLLAGLSGRHLPLTETGLYAWTLDIFAIAVLAAVVVAVVRRAVARPPRMHIAPEGYVILGLIAFLMLTLLVFESAGIAAGQLETGVTAPPLASFLTGVYPAGSSAALFAGAWWAHVVTILAFAVYLPRTKHLHIVTTLPNVYFRSSRPRGALQLIEDIENKETFGAANIRDFSWKQLLDGYT
jgi:hypothetical protein